MKYKFKGIDCINCSIELEKYLCENYGNVKIDFLNKNIEIENQDVDRLLKVAREKEIYFDIYKEDYFYDEKKELKELNYNNFTNFIALIIFLIALFMEKYLYLYIKYDSDLYYIFNFLYIVSFLISGYNIILESIKLIKKEDIFNEKTLMTLSFLGSLYLHLFEEAAALAILYRLGEYFQNFSVIKSRKYVKNIVSDENEVVKLKDGTFKNIFDVKIGDELIISLGEKIKFDSKILKGQSEIDNKMISGESKTVYVKEGDKILAGSINLFSPIIIKVLKEYEDSNIYKMLKLIEDSSNNKSKMETYITKFSRIYMPMMLLISFLVMILPPIFFYRHDFKDAMYNAITILIIACPCSLLLSIPLAFFSAIGRAAKSGILIKKSNILDNVLDMNMLIVDKTGTITKGNLAIKKVCGDLEKYKHIITKAVSLSNHLVSKSIYKYLINEYNLDSKKISEINIKNISELPGRGLKFEIDNDIFILGNKEFLVENGIEVKDESLTYFSFNENVVLKFLIEDEIKGDSLFAINKLKKNGIKNIVMLSGDTKEVTEYIGNKMGIKEYFSNLNPKQKLEYLKEKMLDNKVIYIGDGINDGPCIAMADIGIAIGESHDINKENADILFKNNSINDLNKLIMLSKKINRIVLENLILILFVKIGIMIFGIFSFISIWLSIFADVGIGLIAILNSMRILKFNIDE